MGNKVYIVMETYFSDADSEINIKGVYRLEEGAIEMVNTLIESDNYGMRKYSTDEGETFLEAYNEGNKYSVWYEEQTLIASKQDLVKVICYRKERIMYRQDAIDEYFELMTCCEGSEQERYLNIYNQLINGLCYCTDEDD